MIYPESAINIYSTKLNLNKIKNKNNKSLNILDCFYKNKVSIYDVKDSEIIITIELEEIYTNINLLKFGEKEKFIYSINVKKNKYNILWKDPNFGSNNGYSNHLERRKLYALERANINIFCIKTMEEALKFVIKRRKENDNLIFISNIGKDLSGKRFIEIVRKIYNYDVMVLFYSNTKEHLKWIKDFSNCLYADYSSYYEKYITNYNIEGLEKLKKEIENEYKIKLKEFSPNILDVPKYMNIINQKYNPYIRHVKIFSKEINKYLCMIKDGENGKVIAKTNDDGVNSIWDATFLDEKTVDNNIIKTITLYSNNFYLKEEKGKIIGFKYMVIWEYKIYNNDKTDNKDLYSFSCIENNSHNFLSIKENEITINEKTNGKYESFQLIDVDEKENDENILYENNSFISYLTKQIRDDTNSISINDSSSKSEIINLINNL